MSEQIAEQIPADSAFSAGFPAIGNDGHVLLRTLGKNIKVWGPAPTDREPDLIEQIEQLPKQAAIARLDQLEEIGEETFFEIGGVLSAIRKNKWFDPFPSFEKWVKKSTVHGVSKARALIQIYDAVVAAKAPWIKIKGLGWTKVRAIARVLTKENAEHWLAVASSNNKLEVIALVRQHLAASNQQPAEAAKPKVNTASLKKKLVALGTTELTNVIVQVLATLDKGTKDQVLQAIGASSID